MATNIMVLQSRNQNKEEKLARDFTVEPSTVRTRMKTRFWVSCIIMLNCQTRAKELKDRVG